MVSSLLSISFSGDGVGDRFGRSPFTQVPNDDWVMGGRVVISEKCADMW